jgi:hypothetical protein
MRSARLQLELITPCRTRSSPPSVALRTLRTGVWPTRFTRSSGRQGVEVPVVRPWFARLERKLIGPLFAPGVLIATSRCTAPARCGAFADRWRIVGGDDGGAGYGSETLIQSPWALKQFMLNML